MRRAFTKYPIALLAIASLAVFSTVGAENAQAEVCPASTTFDLYVADPQGNSIDDGNKAERYENLTFAWSICPDTGVHDNFGNNRFGDYAFVRGVSDQPTGGFNWNVWSDAGDNKNYWVPINDGVPPPPPPPPPSNDTIPPVVTIVSPANGANLTGDSVIFKATATDNKGVTKVEFYSEGVLLKTDFGPNYDVTWELRNVWNGSFRLKARAYDAAGNAGSREIVVTRSNSKVSYPNPFAMSGDDTGLFIGVPSPSGCRTNVPVTRTGKSFPTQSVLFKLNMTVSFCWGNGRITSFGYACNWTEVYWAIDTDPCERSSYAYAWPDSAHQLGGRYFQAEGSAKECLWKLGCWISTNPLVKLWVNANGTYKKETSG